MTTPARHAALPPGLTPRGLSRAEAAAYVGVSPKQLHGRRLASNPQVMR